MDVRHPAAVAAALVTLASLPCLIAWLIVSGDDARERANQAVARLRPTAPTVPPVEHTAAQLRALSARLADTPLTEATRRADLTDRYDVALRRACAALDVPHRLGRLSGMDLELERLRVTEELHRAGLVVGTRRDEQPRDWA
ncbi:hypothetical protein LX16_5152 [Stackebrandtia albiflava]|uniref:Uncharacterized protein n=1 Tax=Stackebrandtia albiflava TaxID=406432 RepID=A0A562ULD4_9ACTN|nr:hypothetical protein [Stackebrandtia albiflava]TWJ06416.1 hypothetical protein LX16_5152 [Stackebrandtia albiflava]